MTGASSGSGSAADAASATDAAEAAEALRTDAATSARSWRRVTRAWQVAFCASLALAALVAAADRQSWYVFVVLAAMAASFTWVLLPVLNEEDDQGDVRRLAAHVVIVTAGCYVAILSDGNVAFIASVALSQFIPLIRMGLGGVSLLAAAALMLTFPVALRDRLSSGSVGAWLISALTAWAVNLFIGSFTGELITGFERRGRLLHQLEEARADLDAAQREAGVRAERERLAREIHDTLAQGFTSILMLVQAADAALDTDPAATRRRLALAERAAREGLAEARALIGGDASADLPLDTALRRAAERLGAELGLGTRVLISGTARPLTAGVQVVTLRVAQEALANVRKHAGADGVEVRLVYGEEALRLLVTDDGVGIGAGAGTTVGTAARGEDGGQADAVDVAGASGAAGTAAGGFGLRSMRERVEQAGGVFEVGPGAGGRGTRVVAEVPYE